MVVSPSATTDVKNLKIAMGDSRPSGDHLSSFNNYWDTSGENTWAQDHPHTYGDWSGKKNILFTARKHLIIDGVTHPIPGAGLFDTYNERLRLSDPNSDLKSHWRLPIALYPESGTGKSITYLKNATWEVEPSHEYVRMNPGRTTLWQEAVVSGNQHAFDWATQLISDLTCDIVCHKERRKKSVP